MAQIKCPKGHYYNDKLYKQCPYCEAGMETISEPPPPEPKKISKLNVAAVAALIIAVASFALVHAKEKDLQAVNLERQAKEASLKKLVNELDEDGTELNKVKEVSELINSIYGYGSEEFHANIPVLIFDAGGESKNLSISGNYQKTFCVMNYFVNENFTSGWCNDITAEWVGDDVKITPGSAKGYNIIHFFNSANDETFDVLVIVK